MLDGLVAVEFLALVNGMGDFILLFKNTEAYFLSCLLATVVC